MKTTKKKEQKRKIKLKLLKQEIPVKYFKVNIIIGLFFVLL